MKYLGNGDGEQTEGCTLDTTNDEQNTTNAEEDGKVSTGIQYHITAQIHSSSKKTGSLSFSVNYYQQLLLKKKHFIDSN